MKQNIVNSPAGIKKKYGTKHRQFDFVELSVIPNFSYKYIMDFWELHKEILKSVLHGYITNHLGMYVGFISFPEKPMK